MFFRQLVRCLSCLIEKGAKHDKSGVSGQTQRAQRLLPNALFQHLRPQLRSQRGCQKQKTPVVARGACRSRQAEEKAGSVISGGNAAFTLQSGDEQGGSIEAGLRADFNHAGRAGDVDFGQPVTDHVDADQ